MSSRLRQLTLRGFKTIKSLESFQPGPLTVLIGANGAGKSNLVSFFRMLSWTLSRPGNLQQYVAENGGASRILHDGPDRTREIETEITIETDAGENQYSSRLVYAAGDTLIYTDEKCRFSSVGSLRKAPWKDLGAGHRESQLLSVQATDQTARVILTLLRRMSVHQFHNTSPTARIRTKWRVGEDYMIKEDGGNLAPFLYRLRDNEPDYYARIVDTIRLVLPFFADFELEPQYGFVMLSWRERNSDLVFDASQAADGMLRAIALITLLLQPEGALPDVLILDEPELGLHPYAINVVGGLIKSISTKTQVIVATQSVLLLDCFDVGDIVVVNRKERESQFRRLNEEELGSWLEEYSLSQLWAKNVIGGRPS